MPTGCSCPYASTTNACVLLILVAIVAAPVLLKDEPEKVPPPVPPAGQPGHHDTSAKTLTVVKSSPGLRDYKERLRHQEPSNPFKQHYTGPVLKGSELNEASTTTSTVEEGSSGGSEGLPAARSRRRRTTGWFSSPSRSRCGSPRPGRSLTGRSKSRSRKTAKKCSRRRPRCRAKRSRSSPTWGSARRRKAAVPGLDDVSAVFGEDKCISGTGSCQLIELDRDPGDLRLRRKQRPLQDQRPQGRTGPTGQS